MNNNVYSHTARNGVNNHPRLTHFNITGVEGAVAPNADVQRYQALVQQRLMAKAMRNWSYS